ncbi:MAG: AsmA family protein [Gammaproteobacteria bacterium]|nr:AsmA family protein [Gammaproteobacteria bacterium]
MGKLIKILVALVVIVIVAVAALPFIIDPNDYRDEIVTAVEDNTGRKLTIDGELGLSVFPWIGIDIGKLALGNAQGFGDQPFAAIDNASVKIKLLPLLAKEVVADTITLNGLQLNLAKNKKGETNWADLAGDSKADDIKDKDSPEGVGLKGLAIGGFEINNATINWQDDSTGQSYQVNNFQLNSGAISPGDPVELALALDLKSSEPQMTARLTLDGTVAVDDAIEKLTVLPLEVTVGASGDTFPNGALKASLSTDITVNLKQLAVGLDNLSVKSGDLDLSGKVALLNLDKQMQLDGNLKLAKLNLRNWLASQGMALPEMASDKALSAFDAFVTMKSDGTNTNITNLKIGLDSSSISGSGKLAGSHIGFDLNIDQINVDDYLPTQQANAAASPSGKASSGKPAPAADNTPLFPVETLRPLDISGKLKISSLVVNKLTAEDVNVQVIAKNGVITTTKKVGRFYQGNFDGKTVLNVAGKTPKLAINANLQNLKAGPLLKDLAEKEVMDGTGRFKMDINSSGNTVADIKKALGGTLSFRFEDGSVKGVNISKILRETKAKFEGKTLPATNEPEQTDFSELSGSAKITRGVLNNQDLSAKSPFLRVRGAGTVNLVKEILNYTVQATVVSSSKGQGGESIKELEGLNIPVKLTGPYTAPSYSVDWGKVLLSSQKAKVDEKVDEKKQELKQKLQDKLGDKLKGFF